MFLLNGHMVRVLPSVTVQLCCITEFTFIVLGRIAHGYLHTITVICYCCWVFLVGWLVDFFFFFLLVAYSGILIKKESNTAVNKN